MAWAMILEVALAKVQVHQQMGVELAMAARVEMEMGLEVTFTVPQKILQWLEAEEVEASTGHLGIHITQMAVQVEASCKSRLGANCVWTVRSVPMGPRVKQSIQ